MFDKLRFFFRIWFPRSGRPQCTNIWKGDYSSWQHAASHCCGYDSSVILNACKASLLKVKNGTAAYERDSVIFPEVQYSWGLLCGLQLAAARNKGRLSVLDFGGSLGSSYYQNRSFLRHMVDTEWSIVEQKKFVDAGKKYFEDEKLKFFDEISECLQVRSPNVLLLSSVIQYIEKPHELLDELVCLNFDIIIVERTPFISREKDLLTIQNVPSDIYSASYPSWFFSITKFSNHFSEKYNLVSRTPWWCDPPMYINRKYLASWDGFIFVNKKSI